MNDLSDNLRVNGFLNHACLPFPRKGQEQDIPNRNDNFILYGLGLAEESYICRTSIRVTVLFL